MQLSLTYIKKTDLFVACLTVLLSSLFVSTPSLAFSNTNYDYISHSVVDNSLIIETDKGQVRLSAYGNAAIEAHYLINDKSFSQDKKKAQLQQLPSFALKEKISKSPFQLSADNKQLTFALKQLKAVITKSPFNISYYQNEKLLIAEEAGVFLGNAQEENKSIDQTSKQKSPTHFVQGFRFKLTAQEKILGGGERVLGMDRRGHRMPLYNKAHYGYETHSNQMNFGLPAVMSSNKYILLFDNSAKGWLDIAKSEDNILQFEAISGRLSYLVFAGESYPELINNYVDVTGKQPMPPRWALGNFASRFGYRSEQEVRDTVNKFIELDFPLDALILDLYWFGKDIKGHMGNLDWDKDTFPTPKSMIADIKKQGVDTVLITEPFILTSSKKWLDAVNNNALAKTADGEAKRFDFYFGNTGLVDVFNEQGRNWFNDIYKILDKQGVSGWWGDLGEPEVHPSDALHILDDGTVVNADAIHNVYGHQWAKMVFDNQLALKPETRPFILMRSGFAGSQRYGMIPWTGDVSRSWGGLKPQVELSLQMSLFGMAYTHSDLGGFAGGDKFDKELYIRWLQYGVFQPIYRPHAQDNIAPEVVFHDKETQDILRKFIKLRYQLLPYNYTLAYENSTTGMPLMRPLFFENNKIDNTNSYLWGDAFLVTPVVDADVKSVSVPLPEGVWFDYFTNKHKPSDKYQGGQTVEIATSIETLPVLVRAGSFIPMIDPIQSTKKYDNSELTLHYYADASVKNSSSEMYEDDGKTYQSTEKNQFELLYFSAKQTPRDSIKLDDKELTIKLSRKAETGYQRMPKQRLITLVIHNWVTKPKQLSLSDKLSNKQVKSTWDAKAKTVTVEFIWQHQPLNITLI